MGGTRLRTLQRENFFYKGLGPILRTLTTREEYPWGPMYEPEFIAEISSSRDEDLIQGVCYYRYETSEGSWSTDYNPDNELTDNIWEGVFTIESLKCILIEDLIQLPTITEGEINDKSKGDALCKGIALL